MLTAPELAEALERVADYIDQHRPKGEDAERITFREFSDELKRRLGEQGITPEAQQAHRHDDSVGYANEMVGMALDGNFLIPEFEHQWDLPIAFRRMPEYQPMLEAERRLWDSVGDLSEPTPEQWAALMREYAPWCQAR